MSSFDELWKTKAVKDAVAAIIDHGYQRSAIHVLMQLAYSEGQIDGMANMSYQFDQIANDRSGV